MNKALLMELVRAANEEEVEEITRRNRILSDDTNWKPYGGTRNNLASANNQQGDPIQALIEKPMNSIDAVLTKECWLRGIHPESEQAPKTMEEAVELFFGIPGGDFSEIDEPKRRQLAKNIQIIAEGSKKSPNLIVYDNGEGQHPSDFENTFVSLTKENKIKVKFVQGKYNMGGTGVLPNCGERNFQLIVSRRDQRLLRGKEDLIGFTLVRLHEASDEYKQPWYEYCVDANGTIFSLKDDELDLGLYETKFRTGSFIKLFNYDLPRPSEITLDLWRALNRYLYQPALPILLYEKRDYKGTDSKIMLGNKIRIAIDERDMKETSFPFSISLNGLKFPGEVTLFKEDVERGEFIDKLAIVFTVNGQVHDSLDNRFITTEAKLPWLSGSLLVNVDCTNLPRPASWKFFLASRDRRRDNKLSRALNEEIARELRDHEVLRKYNEKRRDAKMHSNVKDEEFLYKIMNKLLDQNNEISKLLKLNGQAVSNIPKIFQKKLEGPENPFKPKRFPSFMRFSKIGQGNVKMLPQNGESLLTLETDVEDEYLLRPRDRGTLNVSIETPFIPDFHEGKRSPHPNMPLDEPLEVNTVGPNDGHIKLRVKAKKELPVGTQIPVKIELSSPEGPHCLTAFVKIDNPHEKSRNQKINSRKTYSLPKEIEVYRERKPETPVWTDSDYNWNGEDICKIFPSSDAGLIDAVAVNMDADALHNYLRQKKITNDRSVEHSKRMFRMGTFLISLMLYHRLSIEKNIEDPEALLSQLMKGIGNIVMPLMVNEELMKEVEKEYAA